MIGLYKGTSMISTLIKWRTWSEYSHVSWINEDGSVIEAWTDGVCQRKSIHEAHRPGTQIDIFDVKMSLEQKARIKLFLKGEIGKKYDYRGVMKFISRRSGDNQDRWFCSELIAAAFNFADVPLLVRIPVYKIYPGLLAYSPLLRPLGPTLTCPRPAFQVSGFSPHPSLQEVLS